MVCFTTVFLSSQKIMKTICTSSVLLFLLSYSIKSSEGECNAAEQIDGAKEQTIDETHVRGHVDSIRREWLK